MSLYLPFNYWETDTNIQPEAVLFDEILFFILTVRIFLGGSYNMSFVFLTFIMQWWFICVCCYRLCRHVFICTPMDSMSVWYLKVTGLMDHFAVVSYLPPFFYQIQLLSLLQSLDLSEISLTRSAYDLVSLSLLTSSFLFPHFTSAVIFLCRCFDRQSYCSRGWCLDTGWHCAAPWAHAQIREDIRNLSLHVSFNHTGWRDKVFMDLIVEQIQCVFQHVCVCVCILSIFVL